MPQDPSEPSDPEFQQPAQPEAAGLSEELSSLPLPGEKLEQLPARLRKEIQSTASTLRSLFRATWHFFAAGTVCMIIGVLFLLPYLRAHFYPQGTCRVADGHLIVMSELPLRGGGTSYKYAPVFRLSVQTTDGSVYETEGYAASPGFFSEKDARAILDDYHSDQSYSCWYDAANPRYAFLVPGEPSWVGLIFFFVGAFPYVVLLLGIMVLRRAQEEPAPGQHPQDWDRSRAQRSFPSSGRHH